MCYNSQGICSLLIMEKAGIRVGYVLDGIILAVCLICVLIGVHRGFIRSVVHFLGSVIAAVLSSVLGGMLAQWLFDAMFREALIQKINTTIMGLGGDVSIQSAQQIISSLPDFLVRALEEAGITAASISGGIAAQSGQAAAAITDYLAPVFVSFLKVLAVIVLFFLMMILVRALATMVGRMLRLPIIHQLDGLLGGIFGFLLAVFSVWIAIAAVLVFTPMLDPFASAQVDSVLDSSIIAGLFVQMNPLKGLFG